MAEAALSNAGSIEDIFTVLQAFMTEDLVKQINGVFLFDVKSEYRSESTHKCHPDINSTGEL